MRRRTLITAAVVGALVAARKLHCSSRRDDALTIATFNLRNFPSPEQDPAHVAATLDALEADIVAMQEIRDPGALLPLLPGYSVHVSTAGGPRGQRLAVAFDPRRVHLGAQPFEDARIDLGGRVRPAFVSLLATPIGALAIVVVHLKAGREGADARRSQWRGLVELVGELPPPVLVLGDFNTTGGAAERTDLAAALRSVDLVPIVNVEGCSAYWDGVRHDAWQEPSLLDLAFVSRTAEIGALGAMPQAHCARHACEPFVSSDAHPDRDLLRGSDHCPVRFELRQI
jgi:endonuclease/exonuclease/phosphatase family metal-dependent hydrolase